MAYPSTDVDMWHFGVGGWHYCDGDGVLEVTGKRIAMPIFFDRIWAMPNASTFSIKPIRTILEKHCTHGLWLDPYARNSLSRTIAPGCEWITNDLNPACDSDVHMEALTFLQCFPASYVHGVVYDPPYSPRQITECYQSVGKKATMQDTQSSFWSKQKNHIARAVVSGGTVISFGWNSMGMGIKRGFEIVDIYLIPHGGNHNDTIVTVERKK